MDVTSRNVDAFLHVTHVRINSSPVMHSISIRREQDMETIRKESEYIYHAYSVG